jgi:hypothetical protein
MKAMVRDTYGSPDALELADVDVPTTCSCAFTQPASTRGSGIS